MTEEVTMETGKQCSVMDTLEAYREMAKDPQNRKPMLQDTTAMYYLVFLLNKKDEKILMSVLEVFQMLSEKESHRRKLADTLALLDSLNCLVEVYKDSKPKLALAALTLQRRLVAVPVKCHNNKPAETVADSNNSTDVQPAGKVRITALTIKIGGSTVLMEQRVALEAELVKVKGVTAVNMDPSFGECRVYVRPSYFCCEELFQALDLAGFERGANVFGPRGEEIPMPVKQKRSSDSSMVALAPPEYLPEEDSPEPRVDSRAVARWGGIRENASSWINSATSFLARSLYW